MRQILFAGAGDVRAEELFDFDDDFDFDRDL
jgi:hypothetical protein